MTFNDIFKSSFLENVTSISILDMILALVLAFGVGMFIFFIYKKTYQGVMYSSSFGVTLVALTMITTLVILAVTSNVVLSLGMVGALSIVRFRTAIKEPMDLVFLYWAISVGIICGAGLSEIAIILSIVVTLAVFILNRIPLGRAPMILVVNADNDKETNKVIRQIVKKHSRFYTEKSRNISGGQLNLVIELAVQDGSQLTGELSSVRSIHSVSLLSHDGEVTF
jgi:uncharacterized membrane protein YhiD involved in acid resistance